METDFEKSREEILQEVLKYKMAIAEKILEIDPDGIDPGIAVYVGVDMLASALSTLAKAGQLNDKDHAMDCAFALLDKAYDAHQKGARNSLFRN
jgi:hypothetical protein